jgi:tetratricopeptide (TPR) repeat protein
LERLEVDFVLKADFEQISRLKNVAERNQILNEALSIHQQQVEALKRPERKVVSLGSIAASAVAACLIFTLYLGNSDFEYTETSQVERGDATAESTLSDFDAGIKSLKENQPTKAIAYFDKSINNQELTDYYRDAARWYKVVALAEMDKDDEAKTLLNQIENSVGFKYKIGWIEQWKMKVRLIF